MKKDFYLCVMTFSILKHPYTDLRVHAFEELTDIVFKDVEKSSGFINRAKPINDAGYLTNFQKNWGEWGKFCVPKMYIDGSQKGYTKQAQTLSIWEDIASLKAFTYKNHNHRIALSKKRQWFNLQNQPTYCLWWISGTHQPTWKEACKRLELLHAIGPNEHSFNFQFLSTQRL